MAGSVIVTFAIETEQVDVALTTLTTALGPGSTVSIVGQTAVELLTLPAIIERLQLGSAPGTHPLLRGTCAIDDGALEVSGGHDLRNELRVLPVAELLERAKKASLDCNTSPPGWRDTNGYDCVDWEVGGWCNASGALYFGDARIRSIYGGVSANQDCCICGGGASGIPQVKLDAVYSAADPKQYVLTLLLDDEHEADLKAGRPQDSVTLAQAKGPHPNWLPGASASPFVKCNLTGSIDAHPYAYHFEDSIDSPEILDFTSEMLGMPEDSDGNWGFGFAEFSVTGWFRRGPTFGTGLQDDGLTNYATFFAKAWPGPDRIFRGPLMTLHADDEIRFGVRDVETHRLSVTCPDQCLTSGEWVMLTFVRSFRPATVTHDLLSVYVNGDLLGDKVVPKYDVSNHNNLRFGAHPVIEYGQNVDGFLDDIRVYQYALDSREIAALMYDTWQLHCYAIAPPPNARTGSCRIDGAESR